MTSSYLQTNLLQQISSKRKNQHNLITQGFTLIELMVVVAILGVLAAVALPKFTGARDLADSKAKVAEQVGLAKECSAWVATNGTGMTTAPTGCNASTGGTYTVNLDRAAPTGVKCLTVDIAGATTATLTVASTGDITCAAG